jgi:4-amino-4-deoxy-L-arabinose transferase-like glycosyltransferase
VSDLSPRAWRLGVAILLAGALLLATRELNLAPLETHETYVVQTAQEMGQRGDWVVPYFNGEPRLRKPPLSYWLTAFAGRLSGDVGYLEPRHGRLPSGLAGFGLVAVVLWIGVRFYDRRVALMAGSMLVSSLAFFSYTHNARSDMLYAFWCGLGLAAFLQSWLNVKNGERALIAPLVGWVSFALATLTKGPHIPAMFLLAFALWVVVERIPKSSAMRWIRPVTGLGVYLGLIVPWWWLVHQRLDGDGLAGTQLTGSLMRFDGIAFDYVYRLPQLLIPWFVLLPCVLAVDWRESQRGEESRLLALVVAVTIAILSLGPQQRVFYLLPVIAPVLLLISAGTMRILPKQAPWSRARGAIAWLGPGYWVLVVAGLAILLSVTGQVPDLTDSFVLRARVLMVLSLVLGIAFVTITRRRPTAMVSVYGIAILFFVGFWTLGASTHAWTKNRPGLARLGRSAAMLTFPRGEIFTWNVAPDPYVYHSRRPVRVLRSESEVMTELDRFRRRQMVIIGQASQMSALSPAIRSEMIGQPAPYKDRGLALYQLTVTPGSVASLATTEAEPDSVLRTPGHLK